MIELLYVPTQIVLVGGCIWIALLYSMIDACCCCCIFYFILCLSLNNYIYPVIVYTRAIKIEFHFTGIFIIYCSLNTLGNLRQQEVTQKDEWNHGLRLLLIFWHYVLLCIIMCNFLLNLNLHFFRQ